MSDLAQMPSNQAANNFRVNGGSPSTHMRMGQRLEAAAIALPAIGGNVLGNILGASAVGAASLATIPDVSKLHLPVIPSSIKTAMRSVIAPPQFAHASSNVGSALAKGVASLAKGVLRLG